MLPIFSNFSPFPRLPIEIRLKVWSLIHLQPRVITLRYDRQYHQYVSKAPLPAMLHVCRESRNESLKLYKLLFTTGIRTGTYFNFDIDTLYFDEETFKSCGWDIAHLSHETDRLVVESPAETSLVHERPHRTRPFAGEDDPAGQISNLLKMFSREDMQRVQYLAIEYDLWTRIWSQNVAKLAGFSALKILTLTISTELCWDVAEKNLIAFNNETDPDGVIRHESAFIIMGVEDAFERQKEECAGWKPPRVRIMTLT